MAFTLKRLFGERSLTKLAGLYEQRADAERAAADLVRMTELKPAQVRILGPADANFSRRDLFARSVEPEARGIFLTILRAHVFMAMAGAVLGALLYGWLFSQGQPMVRASPGLSLLAIVGFATTFGLLLGGLLSLRPDHTVLMTELRTGLEADRWAVVVHPTDRRQVDSAKQALEASGGQVRATL